MDNVNLALKSRIILKYGTQGMFSKVIPQTENIISAVIRGRHELDKKTKALWARKLKSTVAELFD